MAKKKKLEDWQIEDADRLDALFKEHARLNQTEFGARYGIGTQGMVWQYLSGTRALNIKAAEAFSRGLNVLIDQFSPTIAEQIRSAAERADKSASDIKDWPFASVDEEKVRRLDPEELGRLESAMIDWASSAALDIKKP